MGNSLTVQWLGLRALLPRARVQSLVGELRPCKPCGAAEKKKSEMMSRPINHKLSFEIIESQPFPGKPLKYPATI